MIDTVRFKINVTNEEKQNIEQRSLVFEAFNNEKNVQIYKYYRGSIALGSYNRDISLFVPADNDVIFLEFSAPKFFFGHNIFLLYYDNYIQTLKNVFNELKTYFKNFPELSRWQYQRIDLCYAWKFDNEKQAVCALDIFKNHVLNKKNRSIYDTSFHDKGATITQKMYLKYPEFKAHDFRWFRKKNLDQAYNLLMISQNILRYEVTLRKRALDYHIGKIYALDIKSTDILYLLNFYFSKFAKMTDKRFMSNFTVFEKLNIKYRKSKARSLYMFYRLYFSDNEYDQKFLKLTYSRQAISKNLLLLRKAKIGLSMPDNELLTNLDINIPSQYCVNPDTATGASR